MSNLRMIAGVPPLEDRIYDVSLREIVLRAYHAVAIDEDLEPFDAVLWKTYAIGPDRQQVWFSGGHGEVGGGHVGSEDNRDPMPSR
jgi:hypothetical protein